MRNRGLLAVVVVLGLGGAVRGPDGGGKVAELLRTYGRGSEAAIWVGGVDGAAWFERRAGEAMATASAIKTFYLVELYVAHKDGLDRPIPGADAVLDDDQHPAISHFDPRQRKAIRDGLKGASVRRVGEIMMGKVDASNDVYNAAANLITAAMGGPEALTRLIHDRDPAFQDVFARRYMLRDRTKPGDNEASARAIGALYQGLAGKRLRGVDARTMEAIRGSILKTDVAGAGAHYFKNGSLDTDPITRVLAGWRETKRGALVYVVMVEQPGPGGVEREQAGKELEGLAERLKMVLETGWEREGPDTGGR